MRHKALVDMPITEKMNGPCDVVGFGFGGCEMRADLLWSKVVMCCWET